VCGRRVGRSGRRRADRHRDGRVATIGLAFDPDGRIRTDALTVTLAGAAPALSLPITQRRRDPNFVRLVVAALIGS
jgi:hypothetical protein